MRLSQVLTNCPGLPGSSREDIFIRSAETRDTAARAAIVKTAPRVPLSMSLPLLLLLALYPPHPYDFHVTGDLHGSHAGIPITRHHNTVSAVYGRIMISLRSPHYHHIPGDLPPCGYLHPVDIKGRIQRIENLFPCRGRIPLRIVPDVYPARYLQGQPVLLALVTEERIDEPETAIILRAEAGRENGFPRNFFMLSAKVSLCCFIVSASFPTIFLSASGN